MTKTDITYWLDKYNIKHYTINSDNVVDVNGNVELSGNGLKSIPFQFGTVKGNFYCSYNSLKSLKGCPQVAEGDFICWGNQLTSLKGCPEVVNEVFDCCNNQLDNLKGCPKVAGDFNCDEDMKETLEYKRYLIGRKLREIV